MIDKTDIYIGTNSGRIFHPFAPKLEEVYMPDVVHSLSNKVRWNGHSDFIYVVAQHSLEVLYWLRKQGHDLLTQFLGLIHDTPEAYCVDLPKPIKRGLPEFVTMEQGIWECICIAHCVPIELPQAVHDADVWQLYRESVHLFNNRQVWLLKNPDEELVYQAEIDETFPKVMGYQEVYHTFWIEYNSLYAKLVHEKVIDVGPSGSSLVQHL